MSQINYSEFKIIPGYDSVLYDLLARLYEPFLGRSHMKDKKQYLILAKIKQYLHPAGCISLGRSNFIQIGLAPAFAGEGLARLLIMEFVTKIKPLEKVGWTAHRDNYPSLKLLRLLKGGINERCLKTKNRVNMEGFFRPQGAAPERMRLSLDVIIPQALENYLEWLKTKYSRRTELADEVMAYVQQERVSLKQAE